MATLKALIFDLDGTIAETEDAHRAAFNRAFQEAGRPWHWDADVWSRLLEVAGGRNRLSAWLAEAHPHLLKGRGATALLDTLHGAKDRLYRAMVEGGEIPLRPGIRALIAEARAAGLKVAVATTSRRAVAERVLRCCLDPAAPDQLDAFLGHEDATYRKPHPDIYRRAAARLRLHPAECLAIEDSAIGVASAVGAGVPVVATVNRYSAGHPFDGALAVLSDLGEGPEHPARVLSRPRRTLAGRCDLSVLRGWHGAAHVRTRTGAADWDTKVLATTFPL